MHCNGQIGDGGDGQCIAELLQFGLDHKGQQGFSLPKEDVTNIFHNLIFTSAHCRSLVRLDIPWI